MQTHNTAISLHTKNSVDEFWRLVDSIRWSADESDADSIRHELMQQLSPSDAKKMKRIATFYVMQLVNQMMQWHSYNEISKMYSLPLLEGAASNIIGGGQFNFDEYVRSPQYIVSELKNVNVGNTFLDALPDEDEYFRTSN